MPNSFFAAVTLLAGMLVAQTAFAASAGQFRFTVLRDGSEVGTHEIDISRKGDETRVDIATDVAVKMAFITLYRFEHDDHEIWRNGRLVRIDSTTDDDGTDKSLHGAFDGENLKIDGTAQKFDAEPSIIPASLWNPKIVEQGRLLNPLDGSEMEVNVKFVGNETVAVHGAPVPARHYSITGQFQRDVWFDEDGTLVQVRFQGFDDSDIRYVLN